MCCTPALRVWRRWQNACNHTFVEWASVLLRLCAVSYCKWLQHHHDIFEQAAQRALRALLKGTW